MTPTPEHIALTPEQIADELDKVEVARKDFIAKRNAMNAAIPPLEATRAEHALYDERYKADHEAERKNYWTALEFAMLAEEKGFANTIRQALGNGKPDAAAGWTDDERRVAMEALEDWQSECSTAHDQDVAAKLVERLKGNGKPEVSEGSPDLHEYMLDVWHDFESEYLTNGQGWVKKDTYTACKAAFKAAWSEGKERAWDAAKAVLSPTKPDVSGSGEVEPVAWQWRSRIKGGAWDYWVPGRYGGETPPFMDIEERPLYASPINTLTGLEWKHPTNSPDHYGELLFKGRKIGSYGCTPKGSTLEFSWGLLDDFDGDDCKVAADGPEARQALWDAAKKWLGEYDRPMASDSAVSLHSTGWPEIRAEEARGDSADHMRHNLSWNMRQGGDCRLMWINQGDWIHYQLLRTPSAAARQHAPEGWQMVPKEPTLEMINAGWPSVSSSWGADLTAAYRAMLAASSLQGGGE